MHAVWFSYADLATVSTSLCDFALASELPGTLVRGGGLPLDANLQLSKWTKGRSANCSSTALRFWSMRCVGDAFQEPRDGRPEHRGGRGSANLRGWNRSRFYFKDTLHACFGRSVLPTRPQRNRSSQPFSAGYMPDVGPSASITMPERSGSALRWFESRECRALA